MLLAQGKITQEMIAMLSKWRHSGFHVFCGNRISPGDEMAMENLARSVIRAPEPLPSYLISPMALMMLAEPLTTCFLPLSRITTVGVERILSSVR